ncbi:hypothetical protein [Deinococcus soli (ex Cha et al. 2016)]|uniref:Uncharacterized protein n=2 Tax=Deinococcus soli (ex Cha et al. 2016) TaxID=1309411 RepID=A0ACC6KKJ5_9DEIO|nr:hypothetical protein [Deinococcus soli (ex Cha et al. 2016)]MDR6218573.1 hypothetical protein [Deinococcus soli (ex Cha et al. 2016)]MDR6328370.1 hypothetical protein [Deinococcus soli (ex Cha et al. 2016)]MDR6752981.1 hypothetical protein [Deinococcus soli (ex Cha et al. 2016)]
MTLEEIRARLGPLWTHRPGGGAGSVGDLYGRLWPLAPGLVVLDGDTHPLDALLASGQRRGPSDQLRPGRARACHANCLRARRHCPDLTVETGFAFTARAGVWVPHTWLRDREGRTIETTTRRDLYYGYVLICAAHEHQGELA